MVQTAQIWLIVDASLTGFIIIPAGILWILTLGLARRRSDPARVSFSWLKACHPFLLLDFILDVVADVASIILLSWEDDNGNVDSVNHTQDAINNLNQVSEYTGLTSVFMEKIVHSLLLIVFVEMGIGFRYAQLKQPPSYRIALRITAYVFAVIILALNAASFGVIDAAVVPLFNGGDFSISAVTRSAALRTAADVIALVVSVAQVLYAAVTVRQYAGLPGKQSAVIYLVATILYTIRMILLVVLTATWVINNTVPPDAWNIVNAVFDSWILFIVLTLLLVIGSRQEKGIWATVQSWMNNGNQAYNPNGNVPPQQQVPYPPQPTYPPGQYPPQQNGWQYPPQDIPQLDSWNRYEMASPQQAVRPEELDSNQTYQPVYYVNGAQGGVIHQQQQQQQPVEVPAERKV